MLSQVIYQSIKTPPNIFQPYTLHKRIVKSLSHQKSLGKKKNKAKYIKKKTPTTLKFILSFAYSTAVMMVCCRRCFPYIFHRTSHILISTQTYSHTAIRTANKYKFNYNNNFPFSIFFFFVYTTKIHKIFLHYILGCLVLLCTHKFSLLCI
jgi:hypothetical protein